MAIEFETYRSYIICNEMLSKLAVTKKPKTWKEGIEIVGYITRMKNSLDILREECKEDSIKLLSSHPMKLIGFMSFIELCHQQLSRNMRLLGDINDYVGRAEDVKTDNINFHTISITLTKG